MVSFKGGRDKLLLLIALISVWGSHSRVNGQKITDEAFAEEWMKEYNAQLAQKANIYSEKLWRYNTNITTANAESGVNASMEYSKFAEAGRVVANAFDYTNFKNTSLKRLFTLTTAAGISSMKNKTKLEERAKIQLKMESTYSTGGLNKNGKKYVLSDLSNIMANVRNYDELLWAWKGWRDATGRNIRDLYKQYVEIGNEGAREAGFNDTAEIWQSVYETPNFEKNMDDVMQKLKPFYELLHAYVRKKLRNKYGVNVFPPTGHIPAHLLGNMWAQTWNNIEDILRPFENEPSLNVTPKMIKLKYQPKKLFEMSDAFFKSLGMNGVPPLFWNKSMLVKPTDGREVVCHASAWDFSTGKDFRIKQCTEVKMEDFFVAHHEMGHIQYYLNYKDQPQLFRSGANPGFHEAVGDAIALSVQTPDHLRKVGLLDKVVNSTEYDINFLLSMALEKLAFPPFGYLIDKWRWGVFRAKNLQNYDLNQKWWDMRCKYQGIYPPVERSENDFDPGAKYHVPADVPYIRYFFSYTFQFQLHKALCNASGYSGPLHKCDIYFSKAAGTLLSRVLSLGNSEHWSVPMETLTGQTDLKVDAFMEYFKPLRDWLEKELANEKKGWTEACPGPDWYSILNNGSQKCSVSYVTIILFVLIISYFR